MGSLSTTTGSPCGACKFLRRRCTSDCVFAPYFSNEHGPARFAAIHKVFGASNAAKLLSHVPQPDRCEAVVSIAYEAQARLRDPVYGCVSHIFALQQQVASLQCQLMQAKAQVARGMVGSGSMENRCRQGNVYPDPLLQSYMYGQSMSPQSSVDCGDANSHGRLSMPPEMCFGDDFSAAAHIWNKRWAPHEDQTGELQALASRMMRD